MREEVGESEGGIMKEIVSGQPDQAWLLRDMDHDN